MAVETAHPADTTPAIPPKITSFGPPLGATFQSFFPAGGLTPQIGSARRWKAHNKLNLYLQCKRDHSSRLLPQNTFPNLGCWGYERPLSEWWDFLKWIFISDTYPSQSDQYDFPTRPIVEQRTVERQQYSDFR